MGVPTILLSAQTTRVVGIVVLFIVIYAVLYKPVLKLLGERSSRPRQSIAAVEGSTEGEAPAHGGPDGKEAATAVSRVEKVAFYKDRILLFTVVGVLFLDQLAKFLVRSYLEPYESWPREGFLRLTHGTNTGTAFGLFPNQTFVLILASMLAIGFLYYLYRTHAFPMRLLRIAIGLQLGGAFSNLFDRIKDGAVVDFFDVGPWPIFNLADSAIVVGIALLIGATLLSKQTAGK